jgi:hypothetical protein
MAHHIKSFGEMELPFTCKMIECNKCEHFRKIVGVLKNRAFFVDCSATVIIVAGFTTLLHG